MLKYLVPLLLAVACPAQSQQGNPSLSGAQQLELQQRLFEIEINNAPPPQVQELMQREQMARLMAERQLQLQRDTAKLVALSQELKQRIDRAGRSVLSLEAVNTAKEIQKLAKSVQEKMKCPY